MATSPSNPFDQFDSAPASNAFDQFDASAAPGPQLDPSEYDPSSAAYQAKYGATSGNSFAQNALIGSGKFFTDMALGARQLYAQGQDYLQGPQLSGLITGQSRYGALQQEAATKRNTDAAIMATGGGKVGQIGTGVLTALPLSAIPGVGTYAGAAALGGGYGALAPTVEGESRGVNAAVGAGLGVAGQGVSSILGRWLFGPALKGGSFGQSKQAFFGRANQPFMGWNKGTFNRATAESVGSNAAQLDSTALGESAGRLGSIFQEVRSPNVTAPIGADTAQTLATVTRKLTPEAQATFSQSSPVNSLMSYLRSGSARGDQLGDITSDLGAEGTSLATSKDSAERAAGRAMLALKEHVDDVLGSTINDPDLAAAYAAARPQYRNQLMLEGRPNLLNAATGDANPTNIGRFLQRTDKAGYARGGNTSDFYEGARWGQATGGGKAAPAFSIGNLGAPWAAHYALNNPISGVIGGTVSRTGGLLAPYIAPGLPGAGGTLSPALSQTVVSYLEQ